MEILIIATLIAICLAAVLYFILQWCERSTNTVEEDISKTHKVLLGKIMMIYYSRMYIGSMSIEEILSLGIVDAASTYPDPAHIKEELIDKTTKLNEKRLNTRKKELKKLDDAYRHKVLSFSPAFLDIQSEGRYIKIGTGRFAKEHIVSITCPNENDLRKKDFTKERVGVLSPNYDYDGEPMCYALSRMSNYKFSVQPRGYRYDYTRSDLLETIQGIVDAGTLQNSEKMIEEIYADIKEVLVERVRIMGGIFSQDGELVLTTMDALKRSFTSPELTHLREFTNPVMVDERSTSQHINIMFDNGKCESFCYQEYEVIAALDEILEAWGKDYI